MGFTSRAACMQLILLRLCYVSQLPSPCATYGAIDSSGLSLASINPHYTSAYSPIPPYPPGLTKWAQCQTGPCVNACCGTDSSTGFCIDNLITQGGFYNPSEQHACTAFCGETTSLLRSLRCMHNGPFLDKWARALHMYVLSARSDCISLSCYLCPRFCLPRSAHCCTILVHMLACTQPGMYGRTVP